MARKLAVNSYSCVNSAAQFAGIAALKGPQDSVDAMRAEFDRRRKAWSRASIGCPAYAP